jgi:hypothetical protein
MLLGRFEVLRTYNDSTSPFESQTTYDEFCNHLQALDGRDVRAAGDCELHRLLLYTILVVAPF